MAGNERFDDSIGRWLEETAPTGFPSECSTPPSIELAEPGRSLPGAPSWGDVKCLDSSRRSEVRPSWWWPPSWRSTSVSSQGPVASRRLQQVRLRLHRPTIGCHCAQTRSGLRQAEFSGARATARGSWSKKATRTWSSCTPTVRRRRWPTFRNSRIRVCSAFRRNDLARRVERHLRGPYQDIGRAPLLPRRRPLRRRR